MKLNYKVKVGLLAALFAALALGVISRKSAGFDLAASNLIYSLRTSLLTEIMFGVTFLGSTPFIGVLATAIVVALWIKNRKPLSIFLASTLLASVAINNILKYSIHRLRPSISPLENATFYSFPSGHSMNSLVFYGLLAYWAHRSIKNKSLLIVIDCATTLLIAMIGFSRIYLGDHYPTDVIAGFITGACVFYASIGIEARRGDSM